jgi:serine O-acetyltransferase
VTLGAKRFQVDEDGTLVKGNARHPIVEDDVVIYANATILGRITIGRGSVIGGNVWLTRSVPANSKLRRHQCRKRRLGSRPNRRGRVGSTNSLCRGIEPPR